MIYNEGQKCKIVNRGNIQRGHRSTKQTCRIKQQWTDTNRTRHREMYKYNESCFQRKIYIRVHGESPAEMK